MVIGAPRDRRDEIADAIGRCAVRRAGLATHIGCGCLTSLASLGIGVGAVTAFYNFIGNDPFGDGNAVKPIAYGAAVIGSLAVGYIIGKVVSNSASEYVSDAARDNYIIRHP